MLQPIQKLLTKKLKKQSLQQAYVLGVAQSIIGERGRVVSLVQGKLKVTCFDRMVGYELVTQEQEVLNQLKQKLPNLEIERIMVSIDPSSTQLKRR